MKEALEEFVRTYPVKIANWRRELEAEKTRGRKVVVWGSGSKGSRT